MIDPAALREALAEHDDWARSGIELTIPALTDLGAAAREFLRLIETAETVWWCEEHKSSLDDPTDLSCLRASYVDTDLQYQAPWETPCRMVEVVLTVRRET